MISVPQSTLRKWRLSSMGPRSMVCVVLLMTAIPSAFAARATLMSGQQDSSAKRGRKLLDGVNFSGHGKIFKTRTEGQLAASDYAEDGEWSSCLDVPLSGEGDTTRLRVWECNGTPAQSFTVTEVRKHGGHKYYQIKSELPGNLCVAAEEPGSDAFVLLAECDKHDTNQLWRRKKRGPGGLMSEIIGFPGTDFDTCIDTSNGVATMFSCDESEVQRFMVADA